MKAMVVLLLALAAPASADEAWRSVKGAALRELFSDKEFGDGAHFAYRLRRDGTFAGTEMGKDVSGTWRVAADQVCVRWERPPGPDECYDVQADGANVRLLINGSEAWYGTLR